MIKNFLEKDLKIKILIYNGFLKENETGIEYQDRLAHIISSIYDLLEKICIEFNYKQLEETLKQKFKIYQDELTLTSCNLTKLSLFYESCVQLYD